MLYELIDLVPMPKVGGYVLGLFVCLFICFFLSVRLLKNLCAFLVKFFWSGGGWPRDKVLRLDFSEDLDGVQIKQFFKGY